MFFPASKHFCSPGPLNNTFRSKLFWFQFWHGSWASQSPVRQSQRLLYWVCVWTATQFLVNGIYQELSRCSRILWTGQTSRNLCKALQYPRAVHAARIKRRLRDWFWEKVVKANEWFDIACFARRTKVKQWEQMKFSSIARGAILSWEESRTPLCGENVLY